MIINERSGERLASKAVPVKGLLRQALGLMMRRRLEDEGWVFLLPREGRWDVTNLFVLQDIDVLWLDQERRVLKIATVNSWTPHESGIQGTQYLIELPSGAAKSTEPGDTVSWRF